MKNRMGQAQRSTFGVHCGPRRKHSLSLGTLAPGTHDICIKEATVAHVLIGVNRCILVTVK